jgi:protein-tyrosine-phosphatase
MKVLFIGSGCACRLPFAESIFKKKLLEADVTGVEVETANVAEWGLVLTVGSTVQSEASAREVLDDADLIVVMEDKQRDFLTKFMDYSCWSKIHLFWDYCKRKTGMKTNMACNLSYRTESEVVDYGFETLVDRLKTFIKEHFIGDDKEEVVPAI